MSRPAQRPREAFARAGLLLVLLAVPLALAACGSVASGSSAAGGSVVPAISTGPASPSGAAAAQRGPALCAGQRAVTGVVVRRAGSVVRVPQGTFSFPPVTVAPAPAARSLAQALCALPRQRAGTVNCAADLGVFYKLRFTAGRQQFGAVTVGASGCLLVHGLGQARTAAGATAVWTALARAYRLPGPVSPRVFLGHHPGVRTCSRPSTILTKSGKCTAQPGPG